MPKSKLAKIGVWEGGQFVGVVIFGVGATPNVTTSYGCNVGQMCELVRIALNRHHNPVSRIVSIALRILKRSFPGLRLVVSYADPGQGHEGKIYQAMNWLYVGQTAPDQEVFIDGRWAHRRIVRLRGLHLQDMKLRRETPGKYKYLYPLDAAMRKQIAPLAKPYPKRAASIDSDAPAIHAGEDGAEPIAALQLTCERVES